jgi:hypothetical protein
MMHDEIRNGPPGSALQYLISQETGGVPLDLSTIAAIRCRRFAECGRSIANGDTILQENEDGQPLISVCLMHHLQEQRGNAAPVPATSPLAEPAPATVALDGTPAESWLLALRHADAQIAQATGIRGRAIEHLQAAMGDATAATVAGRTVVTWKTSKPGKTLDRKALEAKFGADVIAGFDRDKKAARPFNVLDTDGA